MIKFKLSILFVLFSFFANAQSQKGLSIFKSFESFGFKIREKIPDSLKGCPSRFRINDEAIGKQKIVYSNRYSIGHINPKPFIAFSCRWKEALGSDLQIAIRFSTNNDKSDDDLRDAKFYTPILIDEHYEGNDGYKVSQLQFIDKKYTHFEIRITGTTTKSGIGLRDLKLNFFNPYGITNRLFNKTKPCSEIIKEQEEYEKKIKNRNLLSSSTSENSLPNFDWENKLKLDEAGRGNVMLKEFETTNKVEENVTNSTLRPLACPCPLPAFTTRTQWNCPQGQGLVSGVATNPAVTHLIVHHSAGANTATDWNAVVLSIWNFHIGTSGYSDIGYNWLVAPNGVLYEGRGSNSLTQNVQGAHFCGFNPATMGVCMIGTYTSTDITAAARTTLTNILAWKCCQANIPAIGTALHVSSNLTINRISGHRDGCATECPGTQFYGTLPALRNEVNAAINACSAPPPVCVPSLNISATGCPSTTISFTPTNVQNGGTTPTYAWYLNNVLITTGNSYTLTNAVNGDKVYARMTSNAACATPTQVNSDTITLSCIVVTAIPTIDGLEYCRISPNPNNGNFVVNMHLNKSTQVQYRLVDMQGKAVYQTSKERVIGTVAKTFNQSHLAKASYMLEIYFNGKKIVQKVLVQ